MVTPPHANTVHQVEIQLMTLAQRCVDKIATYTSLNVDRQFNNPLLDVPT